ncbi:hypothetical protein LINGRAHAP2_LOCUS22311 [Linum grandiflorum]
MADQIANHDFSTENARLQAIVSDQAKKLEDIAEAFLYGVGCRYCEWFMTRRKVHVGLLLSGSLSDQVVVELTTENARLRALISSQAKQLEDAANALSATSVHPPVSEGCNPLDKNETP